MLYYAAVARLYICHRSLTYGNTFCIRYLAHTLIRLNKNVHIAKDTV